MAIQREQEPPPTKLNTGQDGVIQKEPTTVSPVSPWRDAHFWLEEISAREIDESTGYKNLRGRVRKPKT